MDLEIIVNPKVNEDGEAVIQVRKLLFRNLDGYDQPTH